MERQIRTAGHFHVIVSAYHKAVHTPATPRRVLVVDDNEDTARSFFELLVVMGHQCEFRTEPKEVLDTARAFRPDLVLLDIGMPEVDGHQVARLLRSEFGAELRIVAITAYARDEDRQRTRKAGFDAHVTKPVDIPILESILSTLKDSPAARVAASLKAPKLL
jgi:CheY-like chemotaxis protein